MFDIKMIDAELVRRAHCPPYSVEAGFGVWEETTIKKLKDQLAETPRKYIDREWRQWELALAERQEELNPKSKFRRVVPVPGLAPMPKELPPSALAREMAHADRPTCWWAVHATGLAFVKRLKERMAN